MHLFHTLAVIAFVVFRALATLPPPMPNGKYLGMSGNKVYLLGFYRGSQDPSQGAQWTIPTEPAIAPSNREVGEGGLGIARPEREREREWEREGVEKESHEKPGRSHWRNSG